RTDNRIQQAQALLSRSPNNLQADAEIQIALQRQETARAELTAGHLRIAIGLTLEAPTHADTAILPLRAVDPLRVQTQIARARGSIDRARDQGNECPNDRARAQLHVGESMLGRAQDALDSGRPLAALQLARGAREHARRALQLCQIEDNVQDSVEHALQRT